MARILYLEDQPRQVRGTVVTFIEVELNHQVELVTSLAEAETALSRDPYDAVMVDILLDAQRGLIQFENSGLALVRHLLEGEFTAAGNPVTTPIIIASANWDATIVDDSGRRSTVEDLAQDMGISPRNFLRKPFLAEEILQLLRWVLDEE